MAKNHKKPNPTQAAKLLTAQNRKDFMQRLKYVLNLMTGDEDAIKLLPEFRLDVMYHIRNRAIRVEPGTKQIIDPKVLQEIRETTIALFKSETVPVNNWGGRLSLSDYFTILRTVQHEVQFIMDHPSDNTDDFLFALKPYAENSLENFQVAFDKSLSVLQVTTIEHSSFESDYYWSAFIEKEISEGRDGFYAAFTIYRDPPSKMQIKIDGNTRPVVRVGWGHYKEGVRWCSRPPASFGLPQRDITHTLPVYIQMHALQRISERLDCIKTGMAHYFVYQSLKNGRILKTQNDQYLIELHILDIKAGYLLAMVQDEMVIVRTFLLLTNNGTPEGTKLAKYTGLKKEDKRYLSLDKLSTFMDPALRDEETIQRVFFDAGCSDLFEITHDLVADPAKIKSHVSTKVLLDYLMLRTVDAETSLDFSDALTGARYR